MTNIQDLVDSMEPEEAAKELAEAAKTLFKHLDEDAFRDFFNALLDDGSRDKLTGLVHL